MQRVGYYSANESLTCMGYSYKRPCQNCDVLPHLKDSDIPTPIVIYFGTSQILPMLGVSFNGVDKRDLKGYSGALSERVDATAAALNCLMKAIGNSDSFEEMYYLLKRDYVRIIESCHKALNYMQGVLIPRLNRINKKVPTRAEKTMRAFKTHQYKGRYYPEAISELSEMLGRDIMTQGRALEELNKEFFNTEKVTQL